MKPEKKTTLGVILAGGQSRRMGSKEKSLMRLGGMPMLEHVLKRLSPQVDRVIINANGDPARFDGFGLPVQPDTVPGFAGPLAGILAAMDWVLAEKSGHTHILCSAADTPFFPNTLFQDFARSVAANDAEIAIAASNGHKQPVFGLWSMRLRDLLHRALVEEDIRKVMWFARKHPNVMVEFKPYDNGFGMDPFFNVNTPEELEIAEAALKRHEESVSS